MQKELLALNNVLDNLLTYLAYVANNTDKIMSDIQYNKLIKISLDLDDLVNELGDDV